MDSLVKSSSGFTMSEVLPKDVPLGELITYALQYISVDWKMATAPAHIHALPDELLLEVFSYLGVEDLALSVQFVCRAWSRLCSHDVLWKDSSYQISKTSSYEHVLSVIENTPKLKHIHLTEPNNVILHKVAEHCKDLRTFSVLTVWFWNTDVHIDALSHCVSLLTNVHFLKLPTKFLQYKQLATYVGRLTQLREICMLGLGSGPVELKPVADSCPSLESIDLGEAEWQFSDVKYFLERKSSTLRHFGILAVSVENRFIFPLLTMCENTLNELYLLGRVFRNHHFDSMTLAVIRGLSKLKSLKLHKLRIRENVIEDIFEVKGISHLTKLEISDKFNVKLKSINTVCNNCPNLVTLALRYNIHLVDQGLKYLYKCPRLQELDLSYCKSLTDTAMHHVRKCTTLKSLNLEGCRHLTEEGLRLLLELTDLQDLNLSFCNVGGLCFDLFQLYLRKLKTLNLEFSENIDSTKLTLLREKMPSLRVLFE